jgi:small subunit ribosomal protein S15
MSAEFGKRRAAVLESFFGDWGFGSGLPDSEEVFMSLNVEQKTQIIGDYRKSEYDTGSTEVQVALLTAKIDALSQHLQSNVKDQHGRRGLLGMVGRRKRLLRYLEDTDYEGYKALIARLGLRR